MALEFVVRGLGTVVCGHSTAKHLVRVKYSAGSEGENKQFLCRKCLKSGTYYAQAI